MKKVVVFLLPVLLGYSALAQNAEALPIDTVDINVLWELALENSHTIKKNNLAIQKLVKERDFVNNTWLDMITVSGNLNELSIQQTLGTADEQQNIFFPRYNFAVGIQIGAITGISHSKKLYTKDIDILKEEEQIIESELYKEVKLSYYNYLIYKEKFSLKKSFQELAIASFNSTEQKFLEGDVPLEEFYNAKENYNQFTIDLLETEEAFLIAKVNLETLIGVSVDDLGLGLKSSSAPKRRN